MKKLLSLTLIFCFILTGIFIPLGQEAAYAVTSTPQICGGQYHTISLKDDGTVWTWGQNTHGQLGDGTTTDRHSPVQVTNLNNVTDIALGKFCHSIAMKEDGTVWTWGQNNYGQLGDGTTTNSSLPVQVINLNLIDPISAPENLIASAGNAQVTLSWDTVTDAVYYKAKRAEISGGPYTLIADNITETTFADTGLTNGTTYYYVVSAVKNGTESDNSNEASATPQDTTPSAPTNLTASPGDGQISLAWTAIPGDASYIVKRATTSGGPYTAIASNITGTTYADTGLTNGITYYYVVLAVVDGNESTNSNEASATPQSTTTGDNVLLLITMTNGTIKEYSLSISEFTSFLNWYDAKSDGVGKSYFALSKNFIIGPFQDRKEYIVFDKILSFEVMEYSN